MLQPNIDETQEWTRETLENSERRLALLSMRAALSGGAQKPDLLIWPESSMPNFTEDNFRAITNLIATHKV